ncbi:lipase [Actinosynnema sp. NPDC047251]|nr:lipase [Saccharothrix espanaensis]
MRKRTLVLAVGLAVATTLVAAPAQAAGAKIRLPSLSGRYQVGTTDLHLVGSQQDPWRPEDKRELMVSVTYPAQRGGERAAWMSPAYAQRFGSAIPDLPAGAVDWAATRRHARVSPAVDRTRGGWPVVLFSHGFGSAKELTATLTDDLASHGYVVVSIAHTHEASMVEFPAGRFVTGSVGTDPASFKTALDVRVSDARFVLDELERVDRGGNPDAERDPLPRGLAGALDLSKVGMYGHSYGGFASGETMYHDRRIDAGLNLDGGMGVGGTGTPGEVTKHGLDRPFMLVGADLVDPSTGREVEHSHTETSFDPTWNQFWSNQRGWKRDLHFTGSAHSSFTDFQAVVPQLSRWYSPEKRAAAVGTIDAERSLRAQHDYFSAFFDLHLKGRDRRLFGGNSPCHPDTRFIV